MAFRNILKRKSYKSRSHLIIPDGQVKPDVPLEHWGWISNYIAEKQPDVIVNIGDFADMPSLSSYTEGKAEQEGLRIHKDIAAAQEAMRLLMGEFRDIRGYRPRLILTLGNHEDRLDRYAEDHPKLKGAISTANLGYEEDGWEVYPFLQPVKVDGFEYCHYFQSGSMGRPVTSAKALLNLRQGSAVMGHTQKCDIAIHERTGKIAIMAGICYLHDEGYLSPQGNMNTRRQIIMLHEVAEGHGDPMFVSLEFLRRKYS